MLAAPPPYADDCQMLVSVGLKILPKVPEKLPAHSIKGLINACLQKKDGEITQSMCWLAIVIDLHIGLLILAFLSIWYGNAFYIVECKPYVAIWLMAFGIYHIVIQCVWRLPFLEIWPPLLNPTGKIINHKRRMFGLFFKIVDIHVLLAQLICGIIAIVSMDSTTRICNQYGHFAIFDTLCICMLILPPLLFIIYGCN